MKVEKLITDIKEFMSKTNYNVHMRDMNGDWFWSDSYEIEIDLGCKISVYDWAESSLRYLIKLSEIGIKETTMSIKDTYYYVQVKELISDKTTEEVTK